MSPRHDFSFDIIAEVHAELEQSIPIEGYAEEDWLKEDMMMEQMWADEEFLWGMSFDGKFFYCHYSQCYREEKYCIHCENVLAIEEFGEFCSNNCGED